VPDDDSFYDNYTASGFAKFGPLWAIPTQILPKGAAGFGIGRQSGLVGNLGRPDWPWAYGIPPGYDPFFLGWICRTRKLCGTVCFMALLIPESKPINLAEFNPTFLEKEFNRLRRQQLNRYESAPMPSAKPVRKRGLLSLVERAIQEIGDNTRGRCLSPFFRSIHS